MFILNMLWTWILCAMVLTSGRVVEAGKGNYLELKCLFTVCYCFCFKSKFNLLESAEFHNSSFIFHSITYKTTNQVLCNITKNNNIKTIYYNNITKCCL